MIKNKDEVPGYVLESIIGQGSYGTVYNAKDTRTNKIVAIKILENNANMRESEIMNKLHSKNIVTFIKSGLTNSKHNYIIMEKCFLNLEQYIKSRDDKFSVDEIRELLLELNDGFEEMKNKKVLHRDLKPSNILLYWDKINQITPKISDFGLSKFVDNLQSKIESSTKNQAIGTVLTMAPEVLEGDSESEKSDLWSLGIIIYYMLFKKYPFVGNTEVQIYNNITSNINNLQLGSDNLLASLISSLLCKDKNKRLNWDQYLNHQFFKVKNFGNQNELKLPYFNFICNEHSTTIGAYCIDCQKNICKNCLKKHMGHTYFYLSEVGITQYESENIQYLLKELEKKINKLQQIKSDYERLLKIVKIKDINVFKNDTKNNFKDYLIKSLEIINKKTQIDKSFSMNNIFDTFNSIGENSNELVNKHSFKAHNQHICSMSVFPSGNFISVSKDKTIKIWDSQNNCVQIIPNAHENNISCVNIKDESNFVTCSFDRNIKTWTKNNRNEFENNLIISDAHKSWINKIIYYQNYLISCSQGGEIKYWDGDKNIKTIYETKKIIKSILLLEYENILVCSGDDGTQFYNVNNQTKLFSIPNAKCKYNNALCRLDNDRIILGEVKIIKIISISKKTILDEIENDFSCFGICVVNKKGKFLVGGDSNNINIYNSNNYKLDKVYENAHEDNIEGFIVLNNEDIASFSWDKTIKIWKF